MNNGATWPAVVFAAVVIFFFLLWLEVILVQWLLGLFGFQFGWWTTLGIILVVDLVFGRSAVRFRK